MFWKHWIGIYSCSSFYQIIIKFITKYDFILVTCLFFVLECLYMCMHINKIEFYVPLDQSIGSQLWALSCWLLLLRVIYYKKTYKIILFNFILLLLTISLVFSFRSLRIINFYCWFEFSIIPIFVIILGWGYQPERIIASVTIFFYTVRASLPLLILIIDIIKVRGRRRFFLSNINSIHINSRLRLFWGLGFLVKLPIFGFHIWLPKAHVEAPVVGSIILAGVLLKLGGFGLVLVERNLWAGSGWIWGRGLRLTLVGAGILRIRITRFTDIKVVIAHSSVIHIAMVAVVFIGVRKLGTLGGILTIMAHGFTSSGLFIIANTIYDRRHSRRMIFNKGILGADPSFSLVWFILLVLNFAGPFTVNLLGEIIIISRITSQVVLLSIPISLICFAAVIYSLVLYASTQQGFEATANTSCMIRINSRELLVRVIHIWPCVLIIFRLILHF